MQLKPDILPLFMRTVATLALLALSSLAHSAEISDRMVSANGEKFHILESGDRSAPLVLFLHGFPEHAGIWRDYLRDLGNYHAVAVDQRGYNLSGKPGNLSDYKLSKLIEDIKALSLSLGHQKAALVAHDWGGIVAWHAISKYPETFTKAVILNAPHPRTYAELLKHDAEQKNSAFYQYILKLPFSESLLSLNDHYPLRRAMFEGSKKPFSRAEQEGFRSAWGQGLGGAINYYRANDFRNSEELDSVKPIDIPVLLLWGERDEWLSEKNLEGNERWAKRLTIKRFPDATHWIQHEKTREVLYDIQKFLEKD